MYFWNILWNRWVINFNWDLLAPLWIAKRSSRSSSKLSSGIFEGVPSLVLYIRTQIRVSIKPEDFLRNTETNLKNLDGTENDFYSMWNFIPDTLTLILFYIGSCQLTKYFSFSYVTNSWPPASWPTASWPFSQNSRTQPEPRNINYWQ